MRADKAWLLISTDISTETDYTVFLNEHVAIEIVAKSIGYLAESSLEGIDWDRDDKKTLRDIVRDVANEKWNDVISAWEEWRFDKGPLDDDAELMEIDLVI